MEIDPSKYDVLLVGPRISRLKPFFTQRGYRADAIQGGQEGLEALQSKLYHLVVLELHLEDIEPADFIDYALRTQRNAAYMLMDDPAKSGMIVSTFVRGVDVYVPIPPDEEMLFVQVARHVLAAAARGGGRSEVEQYESEIKNARSSLETAGAQVRRLRDENEQIQAELAMVRATLDEAEEKHTSAMRPMREELNVLREEVARLKRELETERRSSEPLRSEVEELREKSDMLSIIEAENEDLKSRLTRALQRPAGPTPTPATPSMGGAASLLAGMRPATPTLAIALGASSSAIALGAEEELSILDDEEGTGVVPGDEASFILSEGDDGEIILDDEGTLTLAAEEIGDRAKKSVAATLQEPDELILDDDDDDDESSTMVKPGIAPPSEVATNLRLSDLGDDEDSSTLVKPGISSVSELNSASLVSDLLDDDDDDDSSTMVKPGISPASELSEADLAAELLDDDDEEDSSTMVKSGISAASLEADILADALASFDEEAVPSSESTATGVTAPGVRLGLDELLDAPSGFFDEQTINLPARVETRDHPVRVAPPPLVTAQGSHAVVHDEDTRVSVESPASGPFSIPLGMEGMISDLVDDSTRDIPIPDEIQALGAALLDAEVSSILADAQNDGSDVLSDDGDVLDEFDLDAIGGDQSASGPTAGEFSVDDEEATRNIPLPQSILSAASRGDAVAGAYLDHVGAAGTPEGSGKEVTRLANPLDSSLDAYGIGDLELGGDETAALPLPSMGPPALGHEDSSFDEQTAATMVPGSLSDLQPNDLFDDLDFPSTQSSADDAPPVRVDDDAEGVGLDDPLTSAVPLPTHDAIAELASATVMRQLPILPPKTTPMRVPDRGMALGEEDDDMRPQVRDEKALKKKAAGGGRATPDIDIDIDFDD